MCFDINNYDVYDETENISVFPLLLFWFLVIVMKFESAKQCPYQNPALKVFPTNKEKNGYVRLWSIIFVKIKTENQIKIHPPKILGWSIVETNLATSLQVILLKIIWWKKYNNLFGFVVVWQNTLQINLFIDGIRKTKPRTLLLCSVFYVFCLFVLKFVSKRDERWFHC